MSASISLGDLLYCHKYGIQHAAVYIGNNQVLHNSPAAGVEVASFSQYSEGKQIKIIKTAQTDNSLLIKRLQIILAENQGYHFLFNNCEHIANFLINGRKCSPQVQCALMGSLISALICLKAGRGNLLAMILLGGLIGCSLCNLNRHYDGYANPSLEIKYGRLT